MSDSEYEVDIGNEHNSIFIAIEIMIAVLAFTENLVVLIVLYFNIKLKSRVFYFIRSLSLSDFLVGAVAIPCSILINLTPEFLSNHYLCSFVVCLILSIFSVSKLTVLSIALDRLHAVANPISFSQIRAKRVPKISISICWVIGFICGFFPLFGWNDGVEHAEECKFSSKKCNSYFYFRFVLFTVIPFLGISIIYGFIIKELNSYKKQSKIGAISNAKQKELKMTGNLSIIVFVFLLCWIPLNILNFIKAFCRECVIDEDLLTSLIAISHLSSVLNPILYAYRLEEFREALTNIFKRHSINDVLSGTSAQGTSSFEVVQINEKP